jgi:hypothetical protein
MHITINNKRLLHDIFHIGPGISPRLPYQARQRSWRADMGRGLIPGIIWKISCQKSFYHKFHIALFQALTFILQKRSMKRQIAKINP